MDGGSKPPISKSLERDIMEYVNSPPGDTIKDFLEENNMTEVDLSIKLGYVLSDVKSLLNGELHIDKDMAYRLGNVIGPNKDFWERRESFYRRSFLKKKEDVKLDFGEESGFIFKKIFIEYNSAILLEEFSKENDISINMLMRGILVEFFVYRNKDIAKKWAKKSSRYKTKEISFCINSNIWNNTMKILEYEYKNPFYKLNNIVESIIYEKFVK